MNWHSWTKAHLRLTVDFGYYNPQGHLLSGSTTDYPFSSRCYTDDTNYITWAWSRIRTCASFDPGYKSGVVDHCTIQASFSIPVWVFPPLSMFFFNSTNLRGLFEFYIANILMFFESEKLFWIFFVFLYLQYVCFCLQCKYTKISLHCTI